MSEESWCVRPPVRPPVFPKLKGFPNFEKYQEKKNAGFSFLTMILTLIREALVF
jgi:hypothetical protein